MADHLKSPLTAIKSNKLDKKPINAFLRNFVLLFFKETAWTHYAGHIY